mgnify:CR=1 FL=1
MNMQAVGVGDPVRVTLPGGAFAGTVKEVWPNHNWTDETWYLVTGEKPKRFITVARSAVKIGERAA